MARSFQRQLLFNVNALRTCLVFRSELIIHRSRNVYAVCMARLMAIRQLFRSQIDFTAIIAAKHLLLILSVSSRLCDIKSLKDGQALSGNQIPLLN